MPLLLLNPVAASSRRHTLYGVVFQFFKLATATGSTRATSAITSSRAASSPFHALDALRGNTLT